MDLYYNPASPPCRSVLLLMRALNLQPNLKVINTQEKEHLKPEFVKINPQHTVPTLVDNGFTLWESRAILIYLAEKYDKTDAFYPKDPKTRGLIHQRLYFDMDTLGKSFSEYYYVQWMQKTPADPEKFKKIDEAFELLDSFLRAQRYAAGDTLTIADIALLATVLNFELPNHDFSKYASVAKWYEIVKKESPGWEEAYAAMLDVRKLLADHLAK